MKSKADIRRVAAVAVAAVGLSFPAAAQELSPAARFDLEQLELNPSLEGTLAIGNARLLPAWTGRAGVVTHYQRDPLVLFRDGERVGQVVDDRFTLHVIGAYALGDRFEFGLSAPFVASQRGDDMRGIGLAQPSRSGPGTPFLSVKAALGEPLVGEVPLRFAAQVSTGLPVGSRDAVAGDLNLSVLPKVMASADFERFEAHVEAGALVRDQAVAGDFQVGHQARFGAAVTTGTDNLRAELAFRGSVGLLEKGQPFAAEVLAGGRYRFNESAELFAFGGPGFGGSPGTPLYRVLGGLTFTPRQEEQPRIADFDGDTLQDAEDQCPREAGAVENHGCPAQQVAAPAAPALPQRVQFATGEAQVAPSFLATVDEVAAYLKANPELPPVIVDGHADDRGSDELNLKLSVARAEAVRELLVKKGVSASRLVVKGHGSTKPVSTEKTEAAREKNRRVEFQVQASAAVE